jgi:hypothetical protein
MAGADLFVGKRPPPDAALFLFVQLNFMLQRARMVAAFEHQSEISSLPITHEVRDGRMISKPARLCSYVGHWT